jgi:hypothetical protein
MRIGIEGGGSGRVAQLRVWVNFDWFRPAIAMELKFRLLFLLVLLLKNLRACLRTCLPVKPVAPKIMMSNVCTDEAVVAAIITFLAFKKQFLMHLIVLIHLCSFFEAIHLCYVIV